MQKTFLEVPIMQRSSLGERYLQGKGRRRAPESMQGHCRTRLVICQLDFSIALLSILVERHVNNEHRYSMARVGQAMARAGQSQSKGKGRAPEGMRGRCRTRHLPIGLLHCAVGQWLQTGAAWCVHVPPTPANHDTVTLAESACSVDCHD